MAASLVLLVVVVAAWRVAAAGEGSADLVGAPLTTTSTTAGIQLGGPASEATTTLPPVLQPASAPVALPGLPARIAIPALGVDDPVVPVGATPDGRMAVPGVAEAGWWSPGPRPGSGHGSSVVAAHVDYDGRPGVFRDLQRLEAGTEVVVTDDAGTAHRYVVRERFQVSKEQLPRGELFRTGGPPVLTLITCGGEFDRDRRHYDDNIVIRAEPVI
ncbi:class F sortase [Dermatobacter hominis]|uniref:class F sortase n=1 Tax=Dermatobacter hominis TaxID=2884263 RepID=UPI001D1273A1|nr:class F sortase [Dermatobacter hominis]UDY38058.1 class F sortase [Dermatobacter hominis]